MLPTIGLLASLAASIAAPSLPTDSQHLQTAPGPDVAPSDKPKASHDQPSLVVDPNPQWRQDYLRVVPPTRSGRGLLIVALSGGSLVLVKQAIMAYGCGDPGCRLGRLSDRLLLLGSIASISVGMAQRAHYQAYHDALAQRLRPPRRARRVVGAILMGVGAAAFVTDVGLQAACMLGGGPYFAEPAAEDAFSDYYYGCDGWIGTIMMDSGAAAISAGAAMMSWERSYTRDRDIFRRGRIYVVPTVGGLSAVGRF